MIGIPEAIANGVFVWTGAVFSTALWSAIKTALPTRAPARERSPKSPRIVLLRPCAGDEPSLAEALASSRVAAGDANDARRIVVRFLIADKNDGAARKAAEAALELTSANVDARLLVTGALGPNQKADQLARALSAIDDKRADDIIVVADSDVLLDRASFDGVVQPIERGEADASWAPPVEVAPVTSADRISASLLSSSLHAFPILALLDPGGMVGKLFAIRRDALEAASGFEPLVDYLGEDMELSARLRASSLRIHASRRNASSLVRGRAFRAVVERYARWITVIRTQRPWLLASYPLLLAATPLQVAIGLGLALRADARLGLMVCAAAIVARVGVAILTRAIVSRRDGACSSSGRLSDFIAVDVVLLLAFVRAMTTTTISWRGRPLRAVGRRIEFEEKHS